MTAKKLKEERRQFWLKLELNEKVGFYSWKHCDNPRKRVICGKRENAYLLIPAEFGGGHIVEGCYNGYGNFGGRDVYEAVAEWNRKYIKTALEDPCWEGTLGTAMQKIAIAYCDGNEESALEKIKELFPEESDFHYMKREWKREIGIFLACEDNDKIPYPIKIAGKENTVYEDCPFSENDPLQGCY